MLCANEEEERQERAVHDQATMAAEAALAASSLELIATQPSLAVDSAPATADAYTLLAVNGTASDFEAVSSAAIVDEPAAAPAEPTAAAIALAIMRLSPTGLLQLRRLHKLRVLLTKVPAEAQGVLQSAAPAGPAASKLGAQGKDTTSRLLQLQLVQLIKALVVAEETKLGNWADGCGLYPKGKEEARREEMARRAEAAEAAEAALAQAAEAALAQAAEAALARAERARIVEAAEALARPERARIVEAWQAREKEEREEKAREKEAREEKAREKEARREAQAEFEQQQAAEREQRREQQRAQIQQQLKYGLPTDEQAAAQQALFNGRNYGAWPPEALVLAAHLAPEVVRQLTGFSAAVAAAKAAGHVSRSLPEEVMERLASIQGVIEGPILAAGEHAFDGFLSLAYVETDPEDRRQRALHRGLLMALLHYSPLRRRRSGDQPAEVIAVWRHTEMYIISDPSAVTPKGDLLSGPTHVAQHAAHRQIRSKLPRPDALGGYFAHIVQMGGVAPRAEGRQDGTTGSLNIMTDSFNLLPRIFELCVEGRPSGSLSYQIMAEGGDLVDRLARDLGLDLDEPVDLIDGPMFIGCLDLRSGGDPVELLCDVLREPTLLKRISTGKGKGKQDATAAAGETEGDAIAPKEKRRKIVPTLLDILGAQIGALEAMGFNRITEGFRRSKVQRGVPMDGTPVFCLESVDWAEAVKQQPKRFSAK